MQDHKNPSRFCSNIQPFIEKQYQIETFINSTPPLAAVVTKYDVFAFLYRGGKIWKPADIVRAFGKASTEYDAVYKILQELDRLGLAKRGSYGFQAMRNPRNEMLYSLITFCMRNDVSYNELLDRGMARFIGSALSRARFSAKDFSLNPRTFSKYVEILQRSGFLIILARKPFSAILLYSSFLADIAGYFGCRIRKREGRTSIPSGEIEKELAAYRRLRRAHEAEYRNLVESFEVKFIHHSLSIEGNPITLAQTFKLLKENLVSKDLSIDSIMEVRNYRRAFRQMLADSDAQAPLTQETILNYHFLSMQHRQDIAGNVRSVPVVIRGNERFRVAAVDEIEPRLHALLQRYNAFVGERHGLDETLEFTSYLHNEFQHIHPFVDGNSRTTRLLTLHFLRAQGIPVFDIPLGLLESYVEATKGATRRSDAKLLDVLRLIIIYNLKAITERLSGRYSPAIIPRGFEPSGD